MSASDALPKRAWAVLDDANLATTDERLPVFWYRHIAKEFNATHMGGFGTVVRVVVTREKRAKR